MHVGIKEEPFIHGGVIALLFIVFFPVALLLLVIRFIKHRNYTHLKIMDRRLAGHALMILFLLLTVSFIINLSMGNTDPAIAVYSVCTVLFFLPSLLFYYQARKWNSQLYERLRLYRSMIFDEKITSIDYMAEEVKKKPEVVVNELYHLVMMGQLPNVYIDQFDFLVSIEYFDSDGDHLPHDMYASEAKTIECRSCGAKAVLQPGEVKECEYCMSGIQYSDYADK